MPIEDFEEEGLKKIPNLELAQKFFTLQSKHSSNKEKEDAKTILEQHIHEQSKFNYILHLWLDKENTQFCWVRQGEHTHFCWFGKGVHIRLLGQTNGGRMCSQRHKMILKIWLFFE